MSLSTWTPRQWEAVEAKARELVLKGMRYEVASLRAIRWGITEEEKREEEMRDSLDAEIELDKMWGAS